MPGIIKEERLFFREILLVEQPEPIFHFVKDFGKCCGNDHQLLAGQGGQPDLSLGSPFYSGQGEAHDCKNGFQITSNVLHIGITGLEAPLGPDGLAIDIDILDDILQ